MDDKTRALLGDREAAKRLTDAGVVLMQSALTAAETAEMEDAEISSTAPPVAGREKSRVPKMT